MTIIILANRTGDDLWPLSGHLPPALLPVGGRTLLDHVIGQIAVQGTGRILVVLDPSDRQTKPNLRRQAWPGLKIGIRHAAPDRTNTRTLLIRGDMWRDPALLGLAQSNYADVAAAPQQWPEHGLWVLEPGRALPLWQDVVLAVTLHQSRRPTLTRDAVLGLAAYHALAEAASAGQVEGMCLGGWMEASGLRSGLDASIVTYQKVGNGVQIGARSHIERGVRLGDGAIVGEDCLIGQGARLEHAVVVDGSVIAPGLTVRNAIVAGGWLMRMDTGVVLRLDQPGRFSASPPLARAASGC